MTLREVTSLQPSGGAYMLQIVDRPGYFGKKRPRKIEFYDYLFGTGRWSEMWDVNGVPVSFDTAVSLYDESYFRFFESTPAMVSFVQTFGECYDSDMSNIACGCCHDQLAIPRHIQDVSIRRALKRLGVWFDGPSDSLLQIRGTHSNGFCLNPGNVPFHSPDLICRGMVAGPRPNWAKEGSIEDFWQSNKVICRNPVN